VYSVITVALQLDIYTQTRTVYTYIQLFQNVMINFKSMFYGSFGTKSLIIYIYILFDSNITNYMQRSPGKANRSSVSKEVLHLMNLEVHYRIHSGLPPVPILSQINPVLPTPYPTY
jgi:hypothetical protein